MFKGQSEAHFAQVQTEIVQTDDLDITWRKIWDEERQILRDGLKDSPLLLKDSRSFRVSAQGVRAKETPKIPKNHKEMDPEKVNSCFVTKENHGKPKCCF